MKRLVVSIFAICLCLGALAQTRQFGTWVVKRHSDPITDENASTMIASAWSNPTNLEGGLLLRCHQGGIDAILILDPHFRQIDQSTHIEATYRIDKGPAQNTWGSSSTNGKAYFFADAEIPRLIWALRNASNFVFRIKDKDGSTLTYQTEVNRFSEAYEYSTIASCLRSP